MNNCQLPASSGYFGHGPRHREHCLHPPMFFQLTLSLILMQLLINTSAQEESLEARRTSLAQLPLEKLLHVKQTLTSKHIHNKGDTGSSENEEGTALPYRTEADRRRVNGPTRRGDPWAHEKEGKDKDVSSIFQSTVTILSFLAFGGYLLCLLCQSLKNTPVNQIPITVMPSVAPATIISGKKRRKRRSPEDSMIRTLHLIAEGYAAYSIDHSELK
ncbi:uncharacterized protein [Halyomorpha halys]|uniref:uncharacterized protein n=1 Tax=Halyomorpha halys TaxID=286706 RepID=UPI0034D2CD9B